MLVALFVFRLVLSKGHRGYQTALAELWEHCRAANIPLPRARPVTAAAMGNARAKVHEDLFRELHAEVLRRAGATDEKRRWKGHRLYAVDGSKLNLPRGLLDAGYRVPSDNAHYPRGLPSCLYQLRSRLPVDFDLIAHADERRAARAHLDVLSPGDVVVYDRGYFSFAMLRAHVERGLHPVFRLTANACAAVAAFARGGETDAVGGIDPGDGRGGIRLRLVRYEIANQSYFSGHHAAGPRAIPRRRPVEGLPRALGHRGTVQDLEADAPDRAVPRQKRAQGEAGAVRPLRPDHNDQAVLESWRGPA